MVWDSVRQLGGEAPGVGSAFRSIFGDPNEEALQRAQKQASAQQAQGLRDAASIGPGQLQSALQAFAPMNAYLAKMYGGDAALNLPQLAQGTAIPMEYLQARQKAAKDSVPEETNLIDDLGSGIEDAWNEVKSWF